VMITLFLAVLVLGAAVEFFVESSRMAFVSEQKNLINNDIRKLTSELSDNARAANYFVLYKSFKNTDHDSAGDRLAESNAGDYIVLVFQGPLPTLISQTRPISAIIGYYRAPVDPSNPTSMGPVRKFEISFSPASTAPLESLLPDESLINSSNFPKIIELSEGLADGNLFYNFWNKSIVVNGKIIHGNEAKRVTETYNFTISPRG